MCHFVASMISGLVTTAASMPVDIVKTRQVSYIGNDYTTVTRQCFINNHLNIYCQSPSVGAY